MRTITTSTKSPSESIHSSINGIKAETLKQLNALGLLVPEWMVIPSTIFSDYIPETILDHSASDVISFIRNIQLDSSLIDSILNWVHNNRLDNELFAVRSSICIDKSSDHTFAGQLKTNLCVPLSELPEAIVDVWTSPFTPKAAAYRSQWGIPQNSIRIAVIIQKMVPTESSGIAMCFDPSNGSRSNIVISSCYGINTSSTVPRTDCDQFTVNFSGKKPTRISRVYEKKNRVIPNQLTGSGTTMAPVPYSMRSKSSLSSQQVMALATITRAISIKTGKPQILDWILSKGKFHVLQVRAVNSLENIPDTTEKTREWQAPSNPLYPKECIPPFTYSVLKKFNIEAFRSLCNRPGMKRSKLPENDFDFLSYVNGHIYIDKSAYDKITGFLPFGTIRGEKSKSASFSSAILSHFMMFSDYCEINKIRNKLQKSSINEPVPSGKSFLDYTFQELLDMYVHLESQLSHLWKSLVINEHYLNAINVLHLKKGGSKTDCFQRFFEKKFLTDNNSLPEEISGIITIADRINQNQSLKKLFEQSSNLDIRKQLGLDATIPPTTADISFTVIRKNILHLVESYNSDIKEITVIDSDSSNLNSIIDIIRIYVTQPFRNDLQTIANSCIMTAAGDEYHGLNTPVHHHYLHAIVQKFYSQRQSLNRIKRIHFNRLKRLVGLLGNKFYSEGILENAEDFQFLTRDEIKDYISGKSVTSGLKQLVDLRKQEFLNGEKQVLPDSFFTNGVMYHSLSQSILEHDAKHTISLFQGSGNRSAAITGEITIANSTTNLSSILNTILVIQDCSSKWIPCLPFIKGLIVENDTLFSELSLACNQLNIPLIFSPDRYPRNFNNGDCVELDSHSGKITILSRASTSEPPLCK